MTFTTAINNSYDAYQSRFELRDRLITTVIDTTVNTLCEAEEFARDAYDWLRDTRWDDVLGLVVTGLSWIVAAYLYIVLQYVTQVWQCWERFQADTVEPLISVESLSLAGHDEAPYTSASVWGGIWLDVQTVMDMIFCLNNDLVSD